MWVSYGGPLVCESTSNYITPLLTELKCGSPFLPFKLYGSPGFWISCVGPHRDPHVKKVAEKKQSVQYHINHWYSRSIRHLISKSCTHLIEQLSSSSRVVGYITQFGDIYETTASSSIYSLGRITFKRWITPEIDRSLWHPTPCISIYTLGITDSFLFTDLFHTLRTKYPLQVCLFYFFTFPNGVNQTWYFCVGVLTKCASSK